MNNILEKYNISLDGITRIDWKVEESKECSILFYKFNSDQDQDIEKFQERIKNANYKICLVNTSRIINKRVSNIADEDWMELQKALCDQFYPQPETSKYIGITGTNGKTTTADLVRQLLLLKNKKVTTIGTLGVYCNDKKVEDFSLTSPSYIDLRKLFYRYQETEYFAMEVSSHSLEQKRAYKIKFDETIWTSFSQDHLDYHETMENYFNAKKRILDDSKNPIHVSAEDQIIIDRLDLKKVNQVKTTVNLKNKFFQVSYNKKNLALALAALSKMGFSFNDDELESLKPTPGRFEIVELGDNLVVVDFAHTSDALENICLNLKQSFKQTDLVVLFGCGGNRDKSKRIQMGNVAKKYADFICVTSDNPRFEEPISIIKDIERAFDSETRFISIEDRKEAIEYCVKNFNNSVILIAGKGHEAYIDKNGIKEYFNDKEEVIKAYNDLHK